MYLLKGSRGGHRAPQHRGPYSTLPPEAWDISARAGNPWLEATSAGPKVGRDCATQYGQGQLCRSLPPSHAARIPGGLSQGLGSYPLQLKALPTPHAWP